MKIEQKKYTHKVKVSTLRLLEKNDFNYLKTEKLTGVSRSTIKKWEAQLGSQVFSGSSPAELALKKVDAEMKRNDVKIIKKYYEIRQLSLDRIMELIPVETKLEPLVNTLKSISQEITVFDEIDKSKSNSSGQTLIQLVKDKLMQAEQLERSKPVFRLDDE